MKRLDKRIFCPQCGAMRICQPASSYAVCPNGHGKLVPRFTQAEAHQAFVASLPRARRVGRNRFTIEGRKGLFGYRDGNGRRPARPGTPVARDEIIARHVTSARQLIRLFARHGPTRKKKDA